MWRRFTQCWNVEKMNKFPSSYLQAMLLFGIVACADSTLAGENCDLELPPPEAGVIINHGSFMFVFPANIDEAYTGCQSMWFEDGTKMSALYLEHGQTTEYTTSLPVDPTESPRCVYDSSYSKEDSMNNENVIEGNPAKCPAYMVIRHGYKSRTGDREPEIPPGRDLRKRAENAQ